MSDPHAPEPEPAPEQLPPRPLRHFVSLSIYLVSNTLLWGAMLHTAMPKRLGDWFPEHQVGYYFGILGFVGGIVAAVAELVAGALSDRSLHPWGRRRPWVAAGSMLAVGALLLLGAAKSYWQFAGALVLVQLFTNAALGPFTALMPDTVNPREHGKASGYLGMARLIGDTGGIILATALLSTDHLQHADRQTITAFLDRRMLLLCSLMAGLVFLAALYTMVAFRERPLRQRPEAGVGQIVRHSFHLDIKGNPDFFWLCVSRAITNFGFYIFLEYVLYFLEYAIGVPREAAVSTQQKVMLPAIGAALLSSVPAGMISDRVGRRGLIFSAQFAMAVAALGFALAPSMGVVYVLAIPAGLAFGVFTAVEWGLACNLLPKGELARYLGVWNSTQIVPQILALPVGGAIGSALRGLAPQIPGFGWRMDFALACVCCLIGAYFLRHVRDPRERVSPEAVGSAADSD